MDIDVFVVPYDSAQRDVRMGAGPAALLGAGLVKRLEASGHRVRCATLDPDARSWRAEIHTAFELAAELAGRVRAARASGRRPLVLTGNCGAALGICAALGADARIVWADAHGDFNTPETTLGGFLDGMALATLTGRCWTSIARLIPGFVPIEDDHAWLLGARDLDPGEAAALERSAIHRIPAAAIAAALADSIAAALPRSAPLYLHLDLDVLDPEDGRANAFAASHGVRADALVDFCRALVARVDPSVVTLSAYDPAADADGRVRDVAMRVIDALHPHVVDGDVR